MNKSGFQGWSAYGESVVDFLLGRQTVTVGPEGVVAGERWQPAAPVYVITAYNPGRALDSLANEAAQHRLIEVLAERGIAWLPATGRSRDHSWQEPSVAILDVPEEEAIRLGRDFLQDAIFRWDGDRLAVLSCAADDEN